MALSFVGKPVPLRTDKDGVVRVARTRVTLDTLVHAFMEGATPEEMADQYPSLNLADIYAVIAFILSERNEVDSYLRRRQKQAESVRKQNETNFDPRGVRDRLLSRRSGGRS